MGGIAILLSGFIGWLVAHLRDGLPFSDQAAIIWLTVFVLATVGFLDDYLKVKRQHNRGIFWKKKGWITFGITAFLMFILASTTGVVQTISFTRAVSPGWELSGPLFIVWTAVMVWSTTNAVNVTDGLDGLAAGSALFGFLAFTIIAYWAFRNPRIYDIVNPLDLAVLSAALAGVVECGACANIHGRCWSTWIGRSPWNAGCNNKYPFDVVDHLWHQCVGGWLGRSANGSVQSIWQEKAVV
jgi:phospho-N-acetylmuramoyl-pentapeptide-transferase